MFLFADCGGNVTIDNGNVTYSNGSAYGANLTYSCHEGYELKGPSTSRCDANGMWVDNNTTCTIKGNSCILLVRSPNSRDNI